MVFHVLNRAVGRRNLFDKHGDFLAFELVLQETLRIRPMRVCAWCLMPNHWHFVLWPRRDGDLPAFMQQLTNTHVKRWKEHRHETGFGHLYQGRYKSFPVQTDDYFYRVVRYAERNARRANLVARAELWPWSSLGCMSRAGSLRRLLSDWPLPRPTDWTALVNQPQTESELQAIRHCANRGTPYGDEQWVAAMSKQLGLESTGRPRGRPKRVRNE
jgi:putative transposase